MRQLLLWSLLLIALNLATGCTKSQTSDEARKAAHRFHTTDALTSDTIP